MLAGGISSTPEKFPSPNANSHRELRLPRDMRFLGVLTGLSALATLSTLPACFNPTYDVNCKILCSEARRCPGDLKCIDRGSENVCAAPGMKMCPRSDPPEMICHRGNCLALPPAIREGLVLLLWPSNLPSPGVPVATWPDLSGYGNDAKAVITDAPPLVIDDGVRLDSGQLGAGFTVRDNASLDLAASDFVVLVVAGLSTGTPATFFQKSDMQRINPHQIVLAWAFSPTVMATRAVASVNGTTITAGIELMQPSTMVYAVRRTQAHVELRSNGVVLGVDDLATAAITTSNSEDVFLGVASPSARPVDTVEAVVIVDGSVSTDDLMTLELFLRDSLATN